MQTLDILLIGGGGREHALAVALAASPRAGRVLVAPGNGGTASEGGRVVNVPVGAGDVEGLLALAARERVGLVVVGPEAPLVAGVVDRFAAAGIPCFGPTAAAARLEGSKAFAKAFMVRHGIPTARSGTFTEIGAAEAWIEAAGFPVVVKASGLAAGKGVVLPDDAAGAKAAARSMLCEGAFGGAGAEVVIEERLVGEEVSLLAFCDGKTAVSLPPARDHKRIFDGDLGPNTGGMGAFAPTAALDAATRALVEETVLRRTVAAMAAEGAPYVGVLYAGLMLTAEGPRVLEFNCRFGDPEAQVLLPLLGSDLVEVIEACVAGRLSGITVRPGAAATVVMASAGYPGAYARGKVVEGLDAAGALDGVRVYHAGTLRDEAGVWTTGGRVLSVTGVGGDLGEALSRAYDGVARVRVEGAQWRRDIGRGRAARRARVVVLVSGSGSNLQALIDAGAGIGGEIVGVVSNRADAFAVQRAAAAGIEAAVLSHRGFADRAAYDAALAEVVGRFRPDLVVLAGFMRVLGKAFLDAFDAIINLHPALPGAFAGTDAIRRAWEAARRGEITGTGVMVHRVVEEVDAGPVLGVAEVAIDAAAPLEALAAAMHAAEHRLICEVVAAECRRIVG